MIYPFSLKEVSLTVGAVLILSHALAFVMGTPLRHSLVALPRSRVAGTILLLVATVWSLLLVASMDLGEFTPLRNVLLGLIAVGAVLAWMFVEEFLAVRSLGVIALLAAEPLLEAAFLRPEPARLLVVVLAYLWAIAGLFWVGMPYTLRDQIAWVTAAPARWNASALAGLLYGAALVACSIRFF